MLSGSHNATWGSSAAPSRVSLFSARRGETPDGARTRFRSPQGDSGTASFSMFRRFRAGRRRRTQELACSFHVRESLRVELPNIDRRGSGAACALLGMQILASRMLVLGQRPVLIRI